MAVNLFSMTSWGRWREARLTEAKHAVGQLSLADLEGGDLDAVAEGIASKLRREPAALDLDGATCEVHQLPGPTILAAALERAGPREELRYKVAYTGSGEMLWIRPVISCSLGVPVVEGPGHVMITCHSAGEWQRIKAALAETMARLADEVRCWNSIALGEVRGLMAARFRYLKAEQARTQAMRVARWVPGVEVW